MTVELCPLGLILACLLGGWAKRFTLYSPLSARNSSYYLQSEYSLFNRALLQKRHIILRFATHYTAWNDSGAHLSTESRPFSKVSSLLILLFTITVELTFQKFVYKQDSSAKFGQFSKISSLRISLCEMTVELTFENLYRQKTRVRSGGNGNSQKSARFSIY